MTDEQTLAALRAELVEYQRRKLWADAYVAGMSFDTTYTGSLADKAVDDFDQRFLTEEK